MISTALRCTELWSWASRAGWPDTRWPSRLGGTGSPRATSLWATRPTSSSSTQTCTYQTQYHQTYASESAVCLQQSQGQKAGLFIYAFIPQRLDLWRALQQEAARWCLELVYIIEAQILRSEWVVFRAAYYKDSLQLFFNKKKMQLKMMFLNLI